MLQRIREIIWKIIPTRFTSKLTFLDMIEPILANIRFGFPGQSKRVKIIGITGTDGKTTTSFFLHSILSAWGKKTGLITTIKVAYGDKEYSGGLHVTTPAPWKLNQILREMINEKCEYIVMEVTSHAIHQKRIWGIRFDVAGLTNITREHLDVHGGSFEEYKKTKLSLLNRAMVSFKSEDISDEIIKDVTLSIAGDYNRLNAKLAAAMAHELGVPANIIKTGLEAVTIIDGRMQVVYDDEYIVIVDFAHTPHGLETALESGRQYIKDNGRLINVFGAAGERDYEKRPKMGAASSKYADIAIVTAEDPRSENVDDITDQIITGMDQGKMRLNETLFRIPNRTEAIEYAINTLSLPGDVIMITGKGPEASMNFAGVEYEWDEVRAVEEALEKKGST